MQDIKVSKYTVERHNNDKGWVVTTHILTPNKELESAYFISDGEIEHIKDMKIGMVFTMIENISNNSIKSFLKN